MNLLCVYFGTNGCSFVYANKKQNFDLTYFFSPFVFNTYYQALNYTYSDFCNEVITLTLKNLNLTLKNTSVYICSTHALNQIHFKKGITIAASMQSILQDYPETNWYFLDSLNFNINNNFNILPSNDLQNYHGYLQSVPVLQNDFILYDWPFRQLVLSKNANLSLNNQMPLVFSGDRFCISSNSLAISSLLCLDLVVTQGVYDLYLDPCNFLILSKMLLNTPFASKILIKNKLIHLGTLVKSFSQVECLLETPVGTRQLYDLKKDDLFFVPLAVNDISKLHIKSHSLNIEQKQVTGGSLGLIIDTRLPNSANFNSSEINKNLLKIFELLQGVN